MSTIMKHTELQHQKDPVAKEGASTLRELGVPGALATELESAMRLLGATEDDRIVGFTFVTPDGKRHALRAETRVASRDQDKAA
jgi:hypothetical protein